MHSQRWLLHSPPARPTMPLCSCPMALWDSCYLRGRGWPPPTFPFRVKMVHSCSPVSLRLRLVRAAFPVWEWGAVLCARTLSVAVCGRVEVAQFSHWTLRVRKLAFESVNIQWKTWNRLQFNVQCLSELSWATRSIPHCLCRRNEVYSQTLVSAFHDSP